MEDFVLRSYTFFFFQIKTKTLFLGKAKKVTYKRDLNTGFCETNPKNGYRSDLQIKFSLSFISETMIYHAAWI